MGMKRIPPPALDFYSFGFKLELFFCKLFLMGGFWLSTACCCIPPGGGDWAVGWGGLGWGCRSQSPAGRGTVVACCRWYGPSPSSPSPWRRCRRVERAPVMMEEEEGWVKRWTGLSLSSPMETGLREAWALLRPIQRYDSYRREHWSLL